MTPFLIIFFLIFAFGGAAIISALSYWVAPKIRVGARHRALFAFGVFIVSSGALGWSVFGTSKGPVDAARVEQNLPEIARVGGTILRAYIVDDATHYTIFFEFDLKQEQFAELISAGHFRRSSFDGDLLIQDASDWFGRGWDCSDGMHYDTSNFSSREIDHLSLTYCPSLDRAFAVRFWP